MRRSWGLAAAILLVAAGQGLAACQVPAASAHQPHTSSPAAGPASRGPAARVLLVCNGSTKPCPKAFHYRSVQAAVNAAKPGDWVLIWPGVYHEENPARHAGVLITTPDLHIRGLNRATVIIDGSNGTPSHPCPSSLKQQDLTPRDGIVVRKAGGVTIGNLTVCDYLAGPGGEHGIEIWWDGGDGTGKIGLGGYSGSYLTATSTFHPSDAHSQHLARYGIFAGNATGPGQITHSYASNMAAGALYVGACQRSCDALLAYDRGTNSAIGYLGTNSGGRLLITESVFDHNRTGLVASSLNTDDPPPPQDGRCPASTTQSCTIVKYNMITGNNNANAPVYGITPAVGVGIQIDGGQFDTIADNLISDQGAWGVLATDNVDGESESSFSHCQGGLPNIPASGLCLFPARGNRIFGNTFRGNGTFANPTNGDLATESLLPQPPAPRNCFYTNQAPDGSLTSSPPHIETVDGPPCMDPGTGNGPTLLQQLRCDVSQARCTAPQARYPRQTTIDFATVPPLPGMPDPCADVPLNPFCS